MTNFFKKFRGDETGAITVDFVVLTAAILVFSLVVGKSIAAEAVATGERSGAFLATVMDYFRAN